MKKRLLLILLILFSISKVYAEDKVAYLDIDLVVKQSNFGKKLIKELNDINSKNLKILKKDENKLKKLENEINSLKNVITKSELDNKIDNLKKEINLYNKKKEKINNEFETQRKKELNKFLSLASPLIEEFMKKNSIKIILDKKNLFIADPKYDITNDLVNLINLKIKNE